MLKKVLYFLLWLNLTDAKIIIKKLNVENSEKVIKEIKRLIKLTSNFKTNL